MHIGLRDRLVVVTGGALGIGRAVAVGFGAEGARVVVTYSGNEPGARQTAEQVAALGGEGYSRHLDLADERSISRLARGVLAELGPVDVLVNSAGAWRAQLYGHYLLSRALAGPMRQRGHGRIVFVSSAALARTMSRELAGGGVVADVVAPGSASPTDVAAAILGTRVHTPSPVG